MVQLSLVDTSTSVSKNFGEKVGDVCNKKEKEPEEICATDYSNDEQKYEIEVGEDK